MGATYRAKFALLKNDNIQEDLINNLPEPILFCEPYHDADTVSKLSIIKFLISLIFRGQNYANFNFYF